MATAILYDSTRCRQCGGCTDACKFKNDLPHRNDDKLCATTFTVLENHGGHPLRRMCMHCENPACASVCPVGALEKTKEGPVVYHADRCMGCRYCMMACPFGIPKYEWEKAVPTIRKCQMCPDRVQKGKKPFCATFCTWGGIQAGEREEMLALARKRMAEEPGRYHPHIYGEHEVGGTSVLVIAAVPPEKLGLPTNVGTESLPEKTWAALSRLPGVVAAAGVFCASFWWITNRRDRIAEEKAVRTKRTAAPANAGAREETEVHA